MEPRTRSLLFILVLAGCEAGGVGSTRVSPDEFCERLVKIICDASPNCCSEDADDDSCQEFRRSNCKEWHSVLASPGLEQLAGDLPDAFRYRGDVAAAYLRELERAAARCEPISVVPLATRSASVRSIYVTNLEEGDACLSSNGCAEGLGCVGEEFAGSCSLPAGEGERCLDRASCEAGLVCGYDDETDELRCLRPDRLANGERCSGDLNCDSGYCQNSFETRRCAACGDHADCRLGASCDDGVCVVTERPPAPRELGARCRVDAECESRDCWEGECVTADPNHFYCVNPLDELFPAFST